jgi:hypothetical protein
MCPDRPVLDDEIEVTPEMVEAGYGVLEASAITDYLLEGDKITVAQIYRAMQRERRRLKAKER